MRSSQFLWVIGLAGVVLAGFVLADEGGYAPQVGQRHPAFTLPEIRTGKPVSLADYRGQRVLLIQFASW